MKKLAILLVSASLVFAGCQNGEADGKINTSVSQQETKQGILQSLGGASNSSQATHLLRMDDGKTIFLKSEKINLKDQKYKGKLVELSGNLLEKVEGKDVMEVMTIDLIEEEDENSLTNNEIPLWEDYEAPGLGIAFKYRNDYELEKDENILTITKKSEENSEDEESINVNLEEDKALFSFTLHAGETDLIAFLELPGDSMAELSSSGLSKSKVGVNSADAFKKIDGDKIEYFMAIDKGILEIVFVPGEEESKNSDQNMFYDILASLKVYNGNSLSDLEGVSEPETDDEEDTSVDLTGHGEDEVVEEDEVDGGLNTEVTSVVSGYETFTSDGYKFSLLYPKSYYFGNEGSTYNFSSKPLEEGAEIAIKLAVNSGSFPEGKSIPSEKETEIVKIKEGSEVSYYVKGKSRVYKISGGATEDTKMMIMAQSLQD
ncbi:MAG: hypothetical protein ACRCZE_04115 [Candidatus Altimarinota bacterium]